MSTIYLLRHAEKDSAGNITQKGRAEAKLLGKQLPLFEKTYASPSQRTIETAELLTGLQPVIEEALFFPTADKEKSDRINKLSYDNNISFLQAAEIDNDPEVLQNIAIQATKMNTFIDSLLEKYEDEVQILMVSHDLTIVPAMRLRGMKIDAIPYIGGVIVTLDTVTAFP